MTESQKINDRFFLEEIVNRLRKYNENRDAYELEYVNTLCKDWLQELVEATPMTEEERKKNNPNPDQNYYFGSEEELLDYLGIGNKKEE